MKMMNRGVLILLIMISFVEISFGQKQFIKNQYLINDFLLNPAFAGINKRTDIMLLHRKQWLGMDDSPNTSVLTANSYIGKNAGLGGVLYYDENGFNYNSGASLSYAYHLRFNTYYNSMLSFGLSSNTSYSGVDVSDLKKDVFDHAVVDQKGYWNWNFTFGLFYQVRDFRTSLTINDFIASKPTTINTHFEPYRKGDASLLTRYKIGNSKDIVIPGFMYRSSFDFFEQEYSIMLKYIHNIDGKAMKSYNIGVAYQDYMSKGWSQDRSVRWFVELRFSKFAVTYANNIELNTFQKFNSGSHTIGVSYFFPDKSSSCFCFE